MLLTSRKAVLDAMTEFESLGREAFLEKYGFGTALSYFILHNGKTYDSKAIVGAARGFEHPYLGPLKASEFSGGEATVQTTLEALGFVVIRGDQEQEAPSQVHARAVLLTWNPAKWDWSDRDALATQLRAGDRVEIRWSCGNTRDLPIDTRVFILRQGEEPRGLVASGWTVEPPHEAAHWDTDRASDGATALYVAVALDYLVPSTEPPADPRLTEGPLAEVRWTIQRSGISVYGAAADALEELWGHRDETANSPGVDEDLGALEGEVRRRLVAHRKRERRLRQVKINAARASHPRGRLICEVPGCAFDFGERYGALGEGYAQVHHLRPLAEAGGTVRTKLEDLAVVCANCHAMIHIGGQNRELHALIPDPRPDA